MMNKKLVVGVDFGSDSARAILVDLVTGKTISEAAMEYPRWKRGLYCDPVKQQYRQHPEDYLEVLTEIVPQAVEKAGTGMGEYVVGLAIDTTGSTVCPVDKEGIPLAMYPHFHDNPDAMFHLWKDHTAVKEAEELNLAFSSGGIDYTKYQGEYSSEWFWAKILHTMRGSEVVRNTAYNWVEHCDWLTSLLCGKAGGKYPLRSACAAGHKALWNSHFNGLPDRECLEALDPFLGDIYDRFSKPLPAGTCAGMITEEWSQKLKINKYTMIGIGSFDAHAGAVGAGIAPHTMVKVIGTSTVDMMVVKDDEIIDKNLRDLCGMAENSIIPGYIGMEMGQPAFGDTLAWFRNMLLWPLKNLPVPNSILDAQSKERIINYFEQNLISVPEDHAISNETDIVALDWFNGRRYPCLNETVKSAITGLSLGTSVPQIYSALAKAVVMGSKAIYDALRAAGIRNDRIICVGGISNKSPYIMQMLSDALGVPIMVCKETQCCARGAAIYAAVAAGFYSNVEEAQKVFCESYHVTYLPDKIRGELYGMDYEKYKVLGRFMEQMQTSTY